MNQIIFRNYIFDDNNIFAGKLYLKCAPISDVLAVDTFTFEIINDNLPVGLNDKNGAPLRDAIGRRLYARGGGVSNFSGFGSREPVWVYNDTELLGKFYVTDIRSQYKFHGSSAEWYKFACVSAVGLLDNFYHNGGVYIGALAGDVISEIISDVEIETDAAVASSYLSGWLPIDTARNNLRRVLFALGASIVKRNGVPYIAFLNAAEPREIVDAFFLSGSTKEGQIVTGVEVIEHSFFEFAQDEEVVLFDNTDGLGSANSQRVVFEAPCHDLAATGLTLIESGVNYAVVEGIGTLSGKKYTHTTRSVSADTGLTGAVKIVKESENCLVSVLNSQMVANRIANYAACRLTASTDMELASNIKPSENIKYIDAFNDPQEGCVTGMQISLSGTLNSVTDILRDFVPRYTGNSYSHSVVLTGSGTWTVPEGVTALRVILIGGGQGGAGGGNGGRSGYLYETGMFKPLTIRTSEYGGAGGAAGVGGRGGNVYPINISESEFLASYEYSCGSGGAGGSPEEPGENGTDTTFGGYSSSDGAPSVTGIPDALTSIVYAMPALDGVPGGKGADWGDTVAFEGESVVYDGITYSGGAAGANVTGPYHNWGTKTFTGGGGGGAAWGANGGDGGDAYTYDLYGNHYVNAGAAGIGATSPSYIPTLQNYGQGGRGGNGGGGEGYPGDGQYWDDSLHGSGARTSAGSGSAGQDGADGCVLILYS